MKTYLLTFLCLLGMRFAFAQSVQSARTNKMPSYFGELSSNLGDKFGQHRIIAADELDLSKPTVIGNTFLNDSWNKGTLYISHNTQLQTPSFKYDIENNQFLLKNGESLAQDNSADDVRIMHGTHVMAFEMEDTLKGRRFFLNSVNASMNSAGKPVMGFLEILTEGDLILYRKIDTKLLKSNYNVALHAGDKNDRILKKEIYFIGQKDSRELQEISKNKKENLAIFIKNQQKVNEYIKKNNINFNKHNDLVQLVSFYNSLAK